MLKRPEQSLCFQEQCPLGCTRWFSTGHAGLQARRKVNPLPVPLGISDLEQKKALWTAMKSTLFLKEALPVGAFSAFGIGCSLLVASLRLISQRCSLP